jgi:hypothetical protein
VKDISARAASESNYLSSLKRGTRGLTSFAETSASVVPSTSAAPVEAVERKLTDIESHLSSEEPPATVVDLVMFKQVMSGLLSHVRDLRKELQDLRESFE